MTTTIPPSGFCLVAEADESVDRRGGTSTRLRRRGAHPAVVAATAASASLVVLLAALSTSASAFQPHKHQHRQLPLRLLPNTPVSSPASPGWSAPSLSLSVGRKQLQPRYGPLLEKKMAEKNKKTSSGAFLRRTFEPLAVYTSSSSPSSASSNSRTTTTTGRSSRGAASGSSRKQYHHRRHNRHQDRQRQQHHRALSSTISASLPSVSLSLPRALQHENQEAVSEDWWRLLPQEGQQQRQEDVPDQALFDSSTLSLTVSLVKSIVGGGILALPCAVAAMGDGPSVLPVATAMIIGAGSLHAFFFTLIGRVCEETKASTYKQAWERTVGPSSSYWVALVVTLKTALSCLAYLMIMADSLSSLLAMTRADALWTVALTTLLPLTLQRDLKSLAPFSAVGLVGMGVTCGTVMLRFLDGTYAPDLGLYVQDLDVAMQPAISETGVHWWNGIVLACTLATAFVSHYNAPRYHAEADQVNNLDDGKGGNTSHTGSGSSSITTEDRFNAVTGVSFGFSAIIFAATAAAGFLTFGGHSQGLILNNYSVYDPMAVWARVALTVAVVLTFPLPFVGLRDGVMDLLQISSPSSPTDKISTVGATSPPELQGDESEVSAIIAAAVDDHSDFLMPAVSIGLLLALTGAASCLHDLELVLSVGGGTFSTAVAAVFPTLMYRALESSKAESNGIGAVKNASPSAAKHASNPFQWLNEANFALAGMVASVGVGLTGAGMALEKAFH